MTGTPSARSSGHTRTAVTFLCTAYRTETTVVETIESVRSQTRPDWQMVVVDNGMSDEIERVVTPYTVDPRIVLIRQENQRVCGGVNAAARAAEGRYLAVLHTDDLVLPEFMERLVPHLDGSPGVHALACDARFLTGGRIRRGTFRGPVPRRYGVTQPVTLRELVEGWIPYYTALVRRETWETIGGFRPDAPSVEDLAFWLDMVMSEHVIRVVDEPLAVYREDEGSGSRSARGVEIMEEAKERVLTDAVRRAGGDADRAALRAAVVRSRHRRAVVRARRLLIAGDLGGARAAAADALRVRADVRTRVLSWGLTVAPRALLHSYHAKRSLVRHERRLLSYVPARRPRTSASR